jgi:hypothetical protein
MHSYRLCCVANNWAGSVADIYYGLAGIVDEDPNLNIWNDSRFVYHGSKRYRFIMLLMI